MVRVRAAKSKRMSSKQRHKIDRKKKEHKRDLRKAAKALKAKGLGPKRSKKSREMAKLALQVSNSNPDKEKILSNVLMARENARVERSNKRRREQNVAESAPIAKEIPTTRNVLYLPGKQGGNFGVQFTRSLTELVFPPPGENRSVDEIPSVAYLVTLDSRFAVQSVPWTLIDAIVEQSRVYKGTRKVLLLFVFTKMELVSTAALVSQFSLLAVELCKRYTEKAFDGNLVCSFTPFSINHAKLQRHLIRVLHQFMDSDSCKTSKMRSNLDNKICAFVIGLPNTGRRSLCRVLASESNQSSVSMVPLRAAQMQLSRGADAVETKFALPNAKSITLVTFPEDFALLKELRDVSGSDILFRSQGFVERCPEPEHIACVLFEGFHDKVSLYQAFCQPAGDADVEDESEDAKLKVAARFLRGLGKTVRQEKGFHVSPLFVPNAGSMGRLNSSNLTAHVGYTSGQQQSRGNLLDATYSNATPSKLVRISSVVHTPA
ncbi:hypothetical protein AGDE_10689 [Angomonas deanei]|nr:hypothetical protein AGDE_10689 [Angomonas deanei]|eukprot:EPY27592.1 hypothetical protein AGDE_10689 [Angomonas deanei]